MSALPSVLLLAETYHPVLGGGEKHSRSLALGLRARGHAVDVITRRSSEELSPREDDSGVIIHRVGPTGKGRGRKFAMVPSALSLARTLAPKRDILMNGGTRVLALPARVAVAGTRCGLVLRPELNGELDGSLALWGRQASSPSRALVRALARSRNAMLGRVDAVVAISRAIAEEAATSGFPASRVHRIPHGIDMDEYAMATPEVRMAKRRALGLPEDRLLITYTGRLIRGKGLETLFEAMGRLQDLRDVHLLVVGSGEGQVISIEDSLRAAASQPPLAGRVTFTGRLDDIPSVLQASDIFAFPTLDEALGMSAVEAQACGLPAVASRTGGVPDVVADEVTGILVTPGSAQELAAGLRRLVSDPGLRDRFSRAARQRAVAEFSRETMVTRYAELFTRVAEARRSA